MISTHMSFVILLNAELKIETAYTYRNTTTIDRIRCYFCDFIVFNIQAWVISSGNSFLEPRRVFIVLPVKSLLSERPVVYSRSLVYDPIVFLSRLAG
jgi:hypothetical protein